jgi:hypothetical protein
MTRKVNAEYYEAGCFNFSNARKGVPRAAGLKIHTYHL